jgi:hypothetical protein
MSREKLEFDSGETYTRLMAEVKSLVNVSSLTRGMLPAHLHNRLEHSAKTAQEILRDKVIIVKEKEA